MCRQAFPSLVTAAPLAVCRQACPPALKYCPIGPGILQFTGFQCSVPTNPLQISTPVLQAQCPTPLPISANRDTSTVRANPAASLCENSHTSTVPPKPRCFSVRKFSYKHSPPKTPLLLCAKILTQAQSPQNPTASLCENSHTSTVPPKPRCFSARKFSHKHSPPKTPLLLCAKILTQAQSPQNPAAETGHTSTACHSAKPIPADAKHFPESLHQLPWRLPKSSQTSWKCPAHAVTKGRAPQVMESAPSHGSQRIAWFFWLDRACGPSAHARPDSN